MELDPVKLAQAKALLGTATDTDTVDRALALVGFEERVIATFEELAAAGGLVDMWGEEPPAGARGRGRGRRGRRVAEGADG